MKLNSEWKSAKITLSSLTINTKLFFNFLLPNNLIGFHLPTYPDGINVN